MLMTVLLIVHLVITISLVAMVLLQRSEGGGLGMGGGGGFMTTRGTADAMTQTTKILAVCFFMTSISLSLLAGSQRGGAGFEVIEEGPAESELITFPTEEAPAEDQTPQVPVGD